VAVNLTGTRVEEVARGDVLAAVDSGLAPTYLIDAELRFDACEEPPAGARVHVHHGTRETPARMAWLGGRFWQLRLERPLVAARGDRLVIRQIAPPDTLGGGTVLDPHPRKHGPSRELLARLERLARGEVADEPHAGAGTPPRPAPPTSASEPSPLPPSAVALAEVLRAAGFEPPLDAELDPRDLAALREAGIAVRVSKSLHYHRDALLEAQGRVLDLAARGDGTVTLAALRDELGTSRKFAQALLEHLDAQKVTLRRGDAHVVRPSALRRLR
jgi:selenocysteine-specific elongation factor